MKHLFFDLDRTLWDFERNSENALKILFHDLGLDKQLRSFQGFHETYKDINAKLWFDYGRGKITKDVLRVKRFQDTLSTYKIDSPSLAKCLGDGYVEISPYQTQLFPNTKEVLTELQKEYELHIITNGFKEVQFIKLENSGIRNFFNVVICSEDIGKNKPAPDIFQYALSEARASSNESIMIGDDYQVDIIGAEGAGIKGVLFDPNEKYYEGTHEFQISDLIEMHDILPWMNKE